ncbi:XRE family transcriptional regulator [Embleya sp. AB8]|uniref:XRE family transcriptional regulator n=1 Tax=Embleya sp. AB8 TaxID=3156304 RepID=UPI003C764AB5
MRAELLAQNASIDLIANEMARRFRLRPRAAYRAAHGWTQQQAADRVNATAVRTGVDETGTASMDSSRICNFEMWPIGGRRPSLHVLKILAMTYETTVERLVDIDDRRAMDESERLLLGDLTRPLSAEEQTPSRLVLPTTPVPALFDIDAARQALDRTLGTTSVSYAQLDLLDERMEEHRRRYMFTPPQRMLGSLLGDTSEIRSIAAERQPARVQMRLSEALAKLAFLIADALMKLGDIRRSRAWYDTARTAAEDSGNAELRARTAVQAAMLFYYFGSPGQAAQLAREARSIIGPTPTPTACLAAAAEARAAARIGDQDVARSALREARTLFERTERTRDDDAFGFPERRLLFYISGTLVYLDQPTEALEVQHRALMLYPDTAGIDPTLIRLEQAIGMARRHDYTDACHLALDALARVPDGHRTVIVDHRARDVLDSLPATVGRERVVTKFREALAPPLTM